MDARALAVVFSLLAVAFAGCLQETPASTADALLDPALPAPASVKSYLRNLSEPMDGVTVAGSLLEQVRIPSADGILLDTWIVRPDVEGPVPLVLEVTPYYGGGPPVVSGLNLMGELADVLVPRGYAVGISSVRGTGNSEGCFTIGGAQEAKDTAAVIEHLASQPWSNGNVGLIGVSYPGTTPQDVWVEAPPALKTIVPISGISDLYKYNFVNGVPIYVQGYGFNAYYWGMVGLAPAGLSGGVQALDPVSVPGAIRGEACQDQVAVQEAGLRSTLDGNKDAYWQERDFLAELDADPAKARASVFYVHGLQDWNVKPHMMEDWLPALWETGVPMKVWIGQWGHNWPQRDDWWEQVMVAWFDQFLKDADTGILDAPAVQVQDDDGEWRHEAVWPPTDVDWLTLHPDEDGTLGPQPGAGEATYKDFMSDEWTNWIADLAGANNHVLFASEPLAEDLHLSGLPVFEGNVTATGKRASLLLTLAEELPDGTLRAFNFAAMSLNHAENLDSGKSDVSGQTQLVRVRFFPQDDVVHKGSKLVLAAGGNLLTTEGDPSPALRPFSDGSTITLSLQGAHLALPIDRSIVHEDPQPKEP